MMFLLFLYPFLEYVYMKTYLLLYLKNSLVFLFNIYSIASFDWRLKSVKVLKDGLKKLDYKFSFLCKLFDKL